MTSVVPLFRDSAFDAEATQTMGNAYDIACRSLCPNGDCPSSKSCWPARLFKPHSAGSVIPNGLQRLLWELSARSTAT